MITDKLGDITLYNADCMELMKSMPDKSADFILTDIPYQLSLAGGVTKGDFADRKHVKKGKDNPYYFISHGIDYDKVFSEFERIMKVVNACIFCSNKQIAKIMGWWENRGGTLRLCLYGTNPIPYRWEEDTISAIWSLLSMLKKKVRRLTILTAICS